MNFGGLGAAIVNGDFDEDVFGRIFDVFDEDIEVAIIVEEAGVGEFVFEFVAAALAVGRDELVVGVGGLRIFVEIFHPRMRRRAVEVVITFLHVFTVIAFAVGEAEEALFEDGIFSVPKGEGETKTLLIIGNAGEAVFAPMISAGAGLVVAEIIPGVAVLAVVFADGAPLAFAEVGAPFAPWDVLVAGFVETLLFGVHRLNVVAFG